MARALADAGAHVVLVARSAEKLDARAREIRASGGSAETCPLDITDEAAVTESVARIAREHGHLDILVNNAGVLERVELAESTTAGFERVVQTNVTAAYVLARECAKPMSAGSFGRIVNIGSILSLVGRASVLSYTTSKHAIAGLTRALASELGPRGITSNAILPGYFRTEINVVLQQNREFSGMVETRTPLGRWGEPPELGGPLVFLCSEAASYINGHLLVADGGFTGTIQGP
jgi:gluconate 5-dehydrogenase